MANPRTSKTAPDPAAALLATQIDELGDIEARLAPHRADIAREDVLRKAIRQHFDVFIATASCGAKGARYVVSLGPRTLQRTVNAARLIKSIGLKEFAKIALVTLAAVEARKRPADATGLDPDWIDQAQTGPRPLNVFARSEYE